MTEIVDRGWELVAQGDAAAALRHLRAHAGSIEFADLGQLVGRLADTAGFDDLHRAAAALAADPEQAQARFDFGYACIERGVSFLAVPVLTALLRQLPQQRVVYQELVSALEDEGRHAEAAALLREREAQLPDWPDRYLLAYNALLAGDTALAHAVGQQLSEPDDPNWVPAQQRLHRLLSRATVAAQASQLDQRDLRGWHFVLTGGLLGTLSPYGFDAGMTGRWAFVQDSYASCRYGLARLAVILAATGAQPQSVGLLPDRSSQILGRAAADLLGLPAEPFREPRPSQLIVAYQLGEVSPELAHALYQRVPGQILYEHATDWTNPPPVSADVSAQLVEVATPPWDEQLRAGPDQQVERRPADARPEAELAAELRSAPAQPDSGDNSAPPDPDQLLAGFVSRVREQWLTGPRERMRSPGPVPSNRFS